jgi:hypothetical protein
LQQERRANESEKPAYREVPNRIVAWEIRGFRVNSLGGIIETQTLGKHPETLLMTDYERGIRLVKQSDALWLATQLFHFGQQWLYCHNAIMELLSWEVNIESDKLKH